MNYSPENISVSPLFQTKTTISSPIQNQPFFSDAEQEIVHKTCQALEIGHAKEIVLAKGRKEEYFCTISRISEGTAIAFLTYTLDIKIQESKEEAYLRFVKLAGIVRHDILNQITAIMGYFEIMADMIPREIAQFMEKTVKLVQNVRDITETIRYYQAFGIRPATWIPIHDVIQEYQQNPLFRGLAISGSLAGIEIFVDPEFDLSLSRVFQGIIKEYPSVEINCGWEIIEKSKEDEKSSQSLQNDEKYLCIWLLDNVEYFEKCKSKRVFHHTSVTSGLTSFYMLAEACKMTDIIPKIRTDSVCRLELLIPTSSYLIYNNNKIDNNETAQDNNTQYNDRGDEI